MSTATILPASGRAAAISRVKKEKKDVYQIVTERIIGLMESGKLDWTKTWTLNQFPRNYRSGKAYRGINFFLLAFLGYNSPYWLTYKQIQELGGQLKPGEKSSIVTFYKPRYEERENLETHEKVQIQVGALFRYYLVFNLDQTEGIPDKGPVVETVKIPGPEEFLEALRPSIKTGYGNPAYRPKDDIILMPKPSDFKNHEGPAEYYAAYYHEVTHWTGHPSRLNRKGVVDVLEGRGSFGSEVYSQEELVAELGAAFLAAYTEIGEMVEKNSAAYLQGWLGKMKEDTRLIIRSAGQAQTAVDYIFSLISGGGA